MNLKISAWAAIIAAIITIPGFIFGMLLSIIPENKIIYTLSMISVVVSMLITVLLFLGYIRVAKKNKLKFLEVMVYISLIIIFISKIFVISVKGATVFDFILLILLGINGLVLGIAFLKLKKVFNGIATAIGVMYIVDGILMMSIIGAILIPLTLTAASILKAIFFFRASKKYD